MQAAAIMNSFIVKFIFWGIITALAYHICGGVRHLLMDFSCIKENLAAGYPLSSGGDLSSDHYAISFGWSSGMVNNVSALGRNVVHGLVVATSLLHHNYSICPVSPWFFYLSPRSHL